VTDLKSTIGEMKSKGVKLLNETPQIGAHKNPVVFVHPKSTSGTLLEFEEVPAKK
jgi:methylmalonyl-CoA/ethylmalonyl-CoA epimerase